MSERSAEQIRLDIAAEREGLTSDLDSLQGEVRSLVPVAIGVAILFALLLARKRLRIALKLLWWFR